MSAELSPQAQNQLAQLQQIQAQSQALAGQKGQMKNLLNETEAALTELEKMPEDGVVYKNVGEILIKSDVPSTKESLVEKKETLALRTTAIERQEERINERFKQLEEQLKQSMGMAAE